MEAQDAWARVSQGYARWAETASESPTFVTWALGVSSDVEVIRWIVELPPTKRQPNLVFAAARWHGVQTPSSYEHLRDALLHDDGSIRHTILSRATQTNEARRLACLLPAFSLFPQPLALIEVGASAGLCLFPDRWGYEWRGESESVVLGNTPRLVCEISGPAPLPAKVPEVQYRTGVDLNPLDVGSKDEMAWLEQLVWPEQDERRQILRSGIAIARNDPPRIVRGDLLNTLPSLVEEAQRFGTVVVFHSAVIAYLSPEEREQFDNMIRNMVTSGMCHWVSNEGPSVLPTITATGPAIPTPYADNFVLGVDGVMVAHTHQHGASLHWTAAQISSMAS